MSESKSKKYEIDMCNGPLLGKILIFYIPLMLSGVLQLLFNAADIVVVGRYAGSNALAAVGSTSSLINLLVNVFIGLSVGANVLVARFYGAGKQKELTDIVHTAILTSLVSGCILIVLGIALSGPALRLMDTPEDVIDQAVLYMRIYFVGMPFMMAYNFGSAILRAVGDTRRPLYYLLAAGVINVILNLIFVIGFQIGVAGVAIATVISQGVSSALVLRCLMLTDSVYKLDFKQLRIVPDKLVKMLQIGLPAGLQGSLFSISNVLIQSSVNSFGSVAMAGNTAASNIEGFVYTAMNAFHQTAISFTGQNYGAHKIKRIGKILIICQISVMIVGLVLGNAAYFFSGTLLQLYAPNPDDMEVITYGVLRLSIICTTYCLCGMMDVMVGALRGMGYSVMPMLVSLTGACLFRVAWIYTIFQSYRTLRCLYISYPISWALTFAVHLICFLVVYLRMRRKYPESGTVEKEMLGM
ncbi:MAG: MATE family efflux transporter [Bacteroidales bacterium]|nr:MATE family efflux transporter [Lachnoclostridium sp.]MCM1384462.1 MATE family efflux transporter [Lachnoclostridium sp.]MCM1464007.1 MATE family efflux transporter [Bacteroidales bacterium]